MTYEEFFAEVKGVFAGADISDVQEHLAYQFNITGEAEGAFYVEAREGQLYIEPYEYYDRDAIFICSADTLRKLMSGELDPVFAFTTQKLKVEGDLDKALKLKELIDKSKAKKKPAKKAATKKPVAKKATAEKKPAAKKATTAEKKPAVKKTTTKATATKKTTDK
ncbi:MAG: SCP2 sterol-binding domain-containing protein [Lachnospiraceae bacterium]|nr:SCP2 sterol-binding domain-containing protein [Lachnospiraceae bacterium]